MLPSLLESVHTKVTISTGNILNTNKKAGRKSTEELLDSLQLTLGDSDSKLTDSGEILRVSNDLHTKITEHERNNISIGAKMFLNANSIDCVNEAVNALLSVLNVNSLDNLILAYHPKGVMEADEPETGAKINGNESYGVLKWGSKNDKSINELKNIWTILEEYASDKKIAQLGVSDLDIDTLTQLHGFSRIKPTIAQINLSSCCVVPPQLQEFCNKNDIQLLTHSDPEIILPDDAFPQIGLISFKPTWTARYQVHVRCRGLLTAKGYIVGGAKRLEAGDIPRKC